MVNVLDKDKILWYVMRAYKNENTAEDRLSNETYGLELFLYIGIINSDLTHKNRPVRESAEGHRLTRQAASTSCGFPSSIC